jgi:hypothetical protein
MLPGVLAFANDTPSTPPDSEMVYRTNLGRADDLDLLLKQGGNVRAVDNNGVGLLFLAAARKDPEGLSVLHKLIENGIDINSRDSSGRTALFYAARSGNAEMVQYLLDSGVDAYTPDKSGEMARNFAYRAGNTEIVTLMDNFARKKVEQVNSAYEQINRDLLERYRELEEQQTKTNKTLSKAQIAAAEAEQKRLDVERQAILDKRAAEWALAAERIKLAAAANPAPANPAPVNPAPVNPAPVNPAPVNPAPVNPAPVNPVPVNPAPVNPAPVNPAPVNPAPVNPAPVNPAPVNPVPVNPAPAEPANTVPAPTPVISAPVPSLTPAATAPAPSENTAAPEPSQADNEAIQKSGVDNKVLSETFQNTKAKTELEHKILEEQQAADALEKAAKAKQEAAKTQEAVQQIDQSIRSTLLDAARKRDMENKIIEEEQLEKRAQRELEMKIQEEQRAMQESEEETKKRLEKEAAEKAAIELEEKIYDARLQTYLKAEISAEAAQLAIEEQQRLRKDTARRKALIAAKQKSESQRNEVFHDLAYNNCSFQYWYYCYTSGMTTELKSEELRDAIETSKQKVADLQDTLINDYEISPKSIKRIAGSAKKRVFDQLDIMHSSRERRSRGVGNKDDMEKRCSDIALHWDVGAGSVVSERPKPVLDDKNMMVPQTPAQNSPIPTVPKKY